MLCCICSAAANRCLPLPPTLCSCLLPLANQAADWEDVHPLEYLSPFLETVKSPETSGPITLVALSSLHKIISRGILGAAGAGQGWDEVQAWRCSALSSSNRSSPGEQRVAGAAPVHARSLSKRPQHWTCWASQVLQAQPAARLLPRRSRRLQMA